MSKASITQLPRATTSAADEVLTDLAAVLADWAARPEDGRPTRAVLVYLRADPDRDDNTIDREVLGPAGWYPHEVVGLLEVVKAQILRDTAIGPE